jgi:hypothetical protein
LSNTPAGRKRIRNISVAPRRVADSQMNTQMSRPGLGRSPIYGNGPVETFNFPMAKMKCIIFEDSHPFSKPINLKELFHASQKNIVAKKSQIGFTRCKNIQQLFIMICLSSIKRNLNDEGYRLMSAEEWRHHERRTKEINAEKNFDCNAYFVDLDGIDSESIIQKYSSGRQMLTQMDKLQHIQKILRKTGNNKIIVGFVHANAESMEYSCLRPEIKNSGVAIDNLMVTSIGLTEKQHFKIVDREWFSRKRKKLLHKMNGQLYLDVSKEFQEDCKHDVAVSIYIRKVKKGRKLDQICKPITNQTEALSAFENGMKITRVKWLQRMRGRASTVELDAKPFDWDYLDLLRKDKSFLSALERIYDTKEA